MWREGQAGPKSLAIRRSRGRRTGYALHIEVVLVVGSSADSLCAVFLTGRTQITRNSLVGLTGPDEPVKKLAPSSAIGSVGHRLCWLYLFAYRHDASPAEVCVHKDHGPRAQSSIVAPIRPNPVRLQDICIGKARIRSFAGLTRPLCRPPNTLGHAAVQPYTGGSHRPYAVFLDPGCAALECGHGFRAFFFAVIASTFTARTTVTLMQCRLPRSYHPYTLYSAPYNVGSL